jgi:hypothetical protein
MEFDMDVSSVYRNAPTQSTRPNKRVDEAQRAQELQNKQAQIRASDQKQADVKAAAQTQEARRKPVVNTQGQTTGRLVNITA